MTRPTDPELAAMLERGRLAIQARHDAEMAVEIDALETRLRSAVCECGGCEFWRDHTPATAEEVESQAPKLIAGLRASVDANEGKAAE